MLTVSYGWNIGCQPSVMDGIQRDQSSVMGGIKGANRQLQVAYRGPTVSYGWNIDQPSSYRTAIRIPS